MSARDAGRIVCFALDTRATAAKDTEYAQLLSAYLTDLDFRAEAAAVLPESKAQALVALCENESAPRVSFEAASLSLAAAAAA